MLAPSRPSHPFLIWAFVLSVLLHLIAVGGIPHLGWERPQEHKPLPPLQARLVPLAQHDAPAPVRERQKSAEAAKPKPKPKPEPKVVPVAPPSPPPVVAEEQLPVPDVANVDPVVPPFPPGKSVDADYPFTAIDMEFDIYWGADAALVGNMKYGWRFERGRYNIESKMETIGLAALFYGRTYEQRSGGRLDHKGLKPEYYVLKQSGKPEERIDFDWKGGNARLQRGSKLTDLVLQPGTQDLMSMLHQMYFIRPLQESNPLYIATPKHIETNVVELLGEENIESPMGSIRSLHMRYRDPDGGVFEFWLDQDRALLPVRIYSENRKGVILDYRLRAVSAELYH